MKKSLLMLLPFLALGLLSSCNKQEVTFKHGKLVEIIGTHLCEVTYENYDLDYLLKPGKGNNEWAIEEEQGFGCSSVHSGHFYGRNFDFIYRPVETFIVRTPHANGRYQTLGISGGLIPYQAYKMFQGDIEDIEKIVPIFLLDGINEHGLTCSINCVNTADIGGPSEHTNPGKPMLAMEGVVRYVLDYAKTVEEAINLISNRDIVMPRCLTGVRSVGFEVHVMIADSTTTSVIEFVKNDIKIINNANVLTNFYLYQYNEAIKEGKSDPYPAHSLGVECFNSLKEQTKNSECQSIEDMQNLMESIKFTNSNKVNFTSYGYPAYSDHMPVLKDGTVVYWSNHNEHIKEIEDEMIKDDEEMSRILRSNGSILNERSLWCTLHTSCYDMEKKELTIAEHEKYTTDPGVEKYAHNLYHTFSL